MKGFLRDVAIRRLREQAPTVLSVAPPAAPTVLSVAPPAAPAPVQPAPCGHELRSIESKREGQCSKCRGRGAVCNACARPLIGQRGRSVCKPCRVKYDVPDEGIR